MQASSKQARGGDDPASRNASFAGKGVESLPGVAAEYVPKGAKSSDSGLDLDEPELESVCWQMKGTGEWKRAWLAEADATIETVTADSRCESFARICVVVIALREEGKKRRGIGRA